MGNARGVTSPPPARALALLMGVIAAAAVLAGLLSTPSSSASARRPAVVEARMIGHTVTGRPIIAYRVGNPESANRAVAMSTMHGNEPDTRRLLADIRDGRPVKGIDLWLVPVVNPDGLVRHTRKNAHGVDLNRNYPHRWADLDGSYESGPRARSEPETRAMMRFFSEIRPRRVVSFHQPLYGVDKDTKTPSYSRRVADRLDLPRKAFTCGGVCHGTMVGWFNKRFRGTAITAEYGAHPTRHRMRVLAPRQVLSIWGATR